MRLFQKQVATFSRWSLAVSGVAELVSLIFFHFCTHCIASLVGTSIVFFLTRRVTDTCLENEVVVFWIKSLS